MKIRNHCAVSQFCNHLLHKGKKTLQHLLCLTQVKQRSKVYGTNSFRACPCPFWELASTYPPWPQGWGQITKTLYLVFNYSWVCFGLSFPIPFKCQEALLSGHFHLKSVFVLLREQVYVNKCNFYSTLTNLYCFGLLHIPVCIIKHYTSSGF